MKKNNTNNWNNDDSLITDRDDRIIFLMIDSIRDKINMIQQELQLNGLDEITKDKIINVYKTLCNE